MPRFIVLIVTLFLISACQPEPEQTTYSVYVQVDNLERTFVISESMTVESFLAQANILWDDNDRIVPPSYTQVIDGTRITIVRVEEDTVCEEEILPYEDEYRTVEGLAVGEERIQRQGSNGLQEVCYRIIYENGTQQQRIPIDQPEIIEEPVNRIIAIGVNEEVEPINITGTLNYINNGNSWIIRNSSTEKRPLTLSNDLDSLVHELSPDGRYLMYTREAEDSESFVNELWVIDTSNPDNAVRLPITDVLYAEWLITDGYTISYSTSEAQELFPGWNALNNLWFSRIDPTTGELFNPRLVVEDNSGGSYGWWGTVFRWSPDGETIAWSQASAIGIYDDASQPITLTDYDTFRNFQDWSWRSPLSWSFDGDLITSVIHGPTQAGIPAESSPIFSVVVNDVNGTFEAMIAEGAGMWASPKFSPQVENPENPYPQGYIAYLKVRDPNQPINGEYDLVVADRDGSNERIVFPPAGQLGIRSSDYGLAPNDFAWSPDGRQIAVIYQGNLYIVDVVTEAVYQMTFDNGSQHPVWSR
ncbi:MAG: G5 domain-containing protein [Phototrophicaceae bacterium]